MAEPALCVHPVHESGDERVHAEPAEGRQTAGSQNGRSYGEEASWGSVSRCQPKAVPFSLATLPRELIGRVRACSDNDSIFLGGGSAF